MYFLAIFLFFQFGNGVMLGSGKRIFNNRICMMSIIDKSITAPFSSSTTTTPQNVVNDKLLPNNGGTRQIINSLLKNCLSKAFGEDVQDVNPVVDAATKSEFGDYQCNVAMILSKRLKMKPRDIAVKLKEAIANSDIINELEIAGPGFLNIRLTDEYIKKNLQLMTENPKRLNITPKLNPQKIVIDFSSPNIAKEMHVGHLRSTIIGDCLASLLEFLGHNVIRLNHVGDWGTQFGMLIRHLKETHPEALQAAANKDGVDADNSLSLSIGDLAVFYKESKKHFDSDPVFQDAARLEVVKLQGGDPESLRVWRAFCHCSRVEFQKIYDLLDVKLEERGESFYNPMLPSILSELQQQGLAVESGGAQCVFLPGYKNRDGDPLPLMVAKSDGGFLYATTDLAAIRHRAKELEADRILYVTDAGQAQHFTMVLAAAREAGWVGPDVDLVHVPFGVVQGEDGQKLKSRSGDTVKLRELLQEAIRLAEEDLLKRRTSDRLQSTASPAATGNEEEVTLTEEEKLTAKIVGLGAVKYADLSMNRESDYRFSYSKMLALTGNTAPYMLYAYARIQGIRRKALAALGQPVAEAEGETSSPKVEFVLGTPEEATLARQLLKLHDVLEDVENSLYPNKICDYLFELSQKFNQFYEKCPVLKAEDRALQASRTALCSLTADTLSLCLGLLGIKTVEKL